MKEEEKEAIEYFNCETTSQAMYYGSVLVNLIETQKAEIEKRDKIMNLMAEQLTTPIHDKKWVIEYFTKLAEEEKQDGSTICII